MNLKRHIRWVPLYNIDPQTGARVEIFYADRALRGVIRVAPAEGQPGFLPGGVPISRCQQLCPIPQFPTHTRALKGFEKTANAGAIEPLDPVASSLRNSAS